MLQGSNTSLLEPTAKRAAALCGLVWRSHTDPNFHKSPASSFATHAIEAIAIRRAASQADDEASSGASDISSILFTIAEKDGNRSAAADGGFRVWAAAPVKDRMLIAVAGSVVQGKEEVEEAEKLALVMKAEGMAEHLVGELRGFTMPGAAVERVL